MEIVLSVLRRELEKLCRAFQLDPATVVERLAVEYLSWEPSPPIETAEESFQEWAKERRR